MSESYDDTNKLVDLATNKEKKVAAGVVIVNEKGDYLMTKRQLNKQMGGLWEIPGGGIESGESGIEAARREILEEIGYVIQEPVIALGTVLYAPLNLSIELFLVFAEINLRQLSLQKEEVIDVRISSFDEIKELANRGLFTPYDWECCKCVEDYLKNTSLS